MSEGYGEFYSLLRVRGDEDGTAGWLVISTKKNHILRLFLLSKKQKQNYKNRTNRTEAKIEKCFRSGKQETVFSIV